MKLMNKIGLSTAAVLSILAFTGCEDDKSVTYGDDLPLKQIKIPNANFSGVLQDKYGEPIVKHEVCIANKCDKTDSNGVYIIKSVPVSVTDQGNAGGQIVQGDTVTLVIGDVTEKVEQLDENNKTVKVDSITHLGLTASVNIQTMLAGIYKLTGGQDYYTTLDGKLIDTGVIQLPQMGAYMSGRFENINTGESVTSTDTAYFTMADESINRAAGTSEETTEGSSINYVTIANKEKIFTVDVGTDGMFSATGLPYLTSFDVKLSGYQWTTGGRDDANDTAIMTMDNSVADYSIGDVELTPEPSMGDTKAIEFVKITNAVGNGDYTTADFSFTAGDVQNGVVTAASAALPGTFVAPTDSLTLEFNEPLNATKVDSDTVKYVSTYSQEAYATMKELARLGEVQNANTARLASKYETVVDAENALDGYVAMNGGEVNATDNTTFAGLYDAYVTAVKAMVEDANGTDTLDASGHDSITEVSTYQIVSVDGNTSLDRLSANISSANEMVTTADLAGINTISAMYPSVKAVASTPTQLDIDTETNKLGAFDSSEFNVVQTVSSVSATGKNITIELDSDLPANNVVKIGLKTFDVEDASGNLLVVGYGSDDDNLTRTGYITEISVGTAE